MYIGALDIGGTKTIAAISDESGNLLVKSEWPTIIENYNDQFEHSVTIIRKLSRELGIDIKDLIGIGINFPAMIDSKRGELIHAPFARWHNIPVKKIFSHLFNHPNIVVSNDANACGLGEKYFGWGKIYDNYLWITISTGIGCAIVMNGVVIDGTTSVAGEVGHLKVEYNLPRLCSCGQYGCLEAHASGTAISAIVNEYIRDDLEFRSQFESSGLPFNAIGCEQLAKKGSKQALEIFKGVADYLSRGISYCVNILNPQAVILGGGVAKAFDLLIPEVNKYLRQYSVPSALEQFEIHYTKLGYEAAVLGAVAGVMSSQNIVPKDDLERSNEKI